MRKFHFSEMVFLCIRQSIHVPSTFEGPQASCICNACQSDAAVVVVFCYRRPKFSISSQKKGGDIHQVFTY